MEVFDAPHESCEVYILAHPELKDSREAEGPVNEQTPSTEAPTKSVESGLMFFHGLEVIFF